MRVPSFASLALAALLLLSGCAGSTETSSSLSAQSTTSQAAMTSAPSAPAVQPPPPPAPPEVQTWDGHVTVAAGAGGPLGYQGASPQDEPHAFQVADDVTYLVFELVWAPAGAVPSQAMMVRAIGPGDAYFYASGGEGTPESPVLLKVEGPTPGDWTAAALVQEGAAADQDYTFHLSLFRGTVPADAYTSFQGNTTL